MRRKGETEVPQNLQPTNAYNPAIEFTAQLTAYVGPIESISMAIVWSRSSGILLIEYNKDSNIKKIKIYSRHQDNLF